jgi:hypothetical protein
MKKLYIGLITVLVSYNTYASYFVEARLGVEDGYRKVVQHKTNGKLQGTFKGTNYGLRLGKILDSNHIYFEYNPEQDVEIKSVNELAKVSSMFLGYRRYFSNEFFAGGQVGQSSFELEKGPGGVTFTDNPTTQGITYGLNTGYRLLTNAHYYLAFDLAYNIGQYKEDGPSSNPVESIEIQHQYQLNATVGYLF